MNTLKRISPICPKCKGDNSYDIIPGLPNKPEIQLQALDFLAENYTTGNTKYYCVVCDYTWKKYRGKKPYEKIKVIYADVGGYPGPNYQVKIDFTSKRIEHNTSFYESLNLRAGENASLIKEEEIVWFLSELYKSDFVNWAEEYNLLGPVMDGSHWSVRIEYDTYCEIKIGSNHFPTKWTKFCKAVSKISRNDFY